MSRGPAHGGAGRDAGPAWLPDEPVPTPDWMSAEDWEAWCDAIAAVDDEPPGSGWDDEEAHDPDLAPGERVQWSAGFGKGGDADGLPGGSELGFLADAAAGPDDRYADATDGELDGAIAAWDRIEARNPRTSWYVTVTGEQGYAAFHGCARPEPKSHAKRRKREKRGKPRTPVRDGPGTSSTVPAGCRDGPGFSFTREPQGGPPGGFGTWRLRTPGPGPDLIVELYSLSTEDCDHRFAAAGHHPG